MTGQGDGETQVRTLTLPASWPRWKFTSIVALRKALEEYNALSDQDLGQHLGKLNGEDDPEPDPHTMDTWYRLMAQNREIDRRMAKLLMESQFYVRLLHYYYRKGGCLEADGWMVAAKRSGLPYAVRVRRGMDVRRSQFEVVLEMALRELFHTR